MVIVDVHSVALNPTPIAPPPLQPPPPPPPSFFLNCTLSNFSGIVFGIALSPSPQPMVDLAEIIAPRCRMVALGVFGACADVNEAACTLQSAQSSAENLYFWI